MKTFDQLLKQLRRTEKSGLQPIADKSGIPYHTLEKIHKGETANPRIRTVEMLARYFGAKR